MTLCKNSFGILGKIFLKVIEFTIIAEVNIISAWDKMIFAHIYNINTRG